MNTPTLPSNHAERQRPIRLRLETETDPLVRELLLERLHLLVKQENAERVSFSLSADSSYRASRFTHQAPIPCGLRNARDNPGFKQEDHWFFSRLNEKDAKALQKMTDQWTKNFGIPLPRALALKLAGAGRTLNQALNFFNCGVFLQIPSEARFASAVKILEVIEKKTTEVF